MPRNSANTSPTYSMPVNSCMLSQRKLSCTTVVIGSSTIDALGRISQ